MSIIATTTTFAQTASPNSTTSNRFNKRGVPPKSISRAEADRIRLHNQALDALEEAQRLLEKPNPSQSELQTALTYANKAILIEKDYWYSYLWQGKLLRKLGQEEEAYISLKQVLVLRPDRSTSEIQKEYLQDEKDARRLLKEMRYPQLKTADASLPVELYSVRFFNAKKGKTEWTLQMLASATNIAQALGLVTSSTADTVTFSLRGKFITISADTTKAITNDGSFTLGSIPRRILNEIHVSPSEIANFFDTVTSFDKTTGTFSFSSIEREWNLTKLEKLPPINAGRPATGLSIESLAPNFKSRSFQREGKNFQGVIQKLILADEGRYTIAAVTPNSTTFRSSIEIWNTASGELVQTLPGPYGNVTTLAFSPQRRMLAAGTDNGIVHIWDFNAKIGYHLLNFSASPYNSIFKVAFSPDSNELFCGFTSGEFMIFDSSALQPETGSSGPLPQLKTHLRLEDISEVTGYELDWANRKILTTDTRDSLSIWELDSQAKPVIFKSSANLLSGVSLSPDGNQMVLRSSFGIIIQNRDLTTRIKALLPPRASSRTDANAPQPTGARFQGGNRPAPYVLNPMYANNEGAIFGLYAGALVMWSPEKPDGQFLSPAPIPPLVNLWDIPEKPLLTSFHLEAGVPVIVATDIRGGLYIWE